MRKILSLILISLALCSAYAQNLGNPTDYLVITLQDGTTQKVEVSTIKNLTFESVTPTLDGKYVYYEYDTGNVWVLANIKEVQLRKSTDGYWYFYFVDATNGVVSEDKMSNPIVKVSPKFVNCGEVDLSADTQDRWEIGYKDIDLQSHFNEWVNWPDNGKMTLNVDEEAGTLSVQLEIMNSYHYYDGSIKGNHQALKISYTGPIAEYKGSRK